MANDSQNQSGSSEYFAAKPAEETAGVVLKKAHAWSNNLQSNGYIEKLRMSWSAYHGAYYTDASSGHQITFSGSVGEIVNLPVNHLRNIAQHILVMTTASRPTMEARATNTDYKSLTQTVLANGLLDYYMREKRLEGFLKCAVESAIVLGAGYIKMAWNETSGEMYDFNEETNTPIYEGDIEFMNLSPLDVIMDNTKESARENDWIVCRTWKNRFDVIAKYPEFKDAIMRMPSKTEALRYRFNFISNDETDDIAVYEFFHRRSEALPDGRYLMFLAEDIVLSDGPLPYRQLPIFRISPSDIMGTPYGYTSIFDLLPLQEAINSLYSTILTNQNAFGVQNILVPRGSDISIQELTGGLNIIEANIQNGNKPEALNLTSTPAEVFKFAEMIKAEMEVLSGVSSVARGQPEASLKSGNALALIQSMSIQFMSGLQQSYVALIEDVGTSLINMLRDFAAVPRVAAIVGKNNRTFMKEFKGDDLQNVNRVIVDVGNPLARTTAGRVQMAEQLLQMGAITDPNQYFTVINTGRLDVMNEGAQNDLLCIKSENEALMNGENPPVLMTDDHRQHALEHKSVLADPDLRKDPKLVQNVLAHLQEHFNQAQQTDPNLLSWLGQKPLPPSAQPPQGPPPGPQGGPPPAGPSGPGPGPGGPGGASKPPMPMPPPPAQQAGGSIPGLPHPPAPFQHLPTNPAEVPAH
jgi:hypothetical protein